MSESSTEPIPANVDGVGGGGETLSGFEIKKQGWPPGKPVSMVAAVEDGDGNVIYYAGWHFNIWDDGASNHFVSSNEPDNPLSMMPLNNIRFYKGAVEPINPPLGMQPLDEPLFYTAATPQENGQNAVLYKEMNSSEWYDDVGCFWVPDPTNAWQLVNLSP